MEEFAGRVAVVTGAASGIGKALAERFAKAGMKVVLADIEEAALQNAALEMTNAGHSVLPVRTDVSDAANVAALASRTIEAFGAVHIVCNNAGVGTASRFRPAWEYPLEDWHWTLNVNLWGAIHGVRTFMPILLQQDAPGHVVNTSSVAGLIGGSAVSLYGVAKTAVVRLSESIYASLREMDAKIGVSVLCPGPVHTRFAYSERNRPAPLRTDESARLGDDTEWASGQYVSALTPEAVAEMVFDGIKAGQFYLVTSHSYDADIRERMESIIDRRNPRFGDLRESVKQDAAHR